MTTPSNLNTQPINCLTYVDDNGVRIEWLTDAQLQAWLEQDKAEARTPLQLLSRPPHRDPDYWPSRSALIVRGSVQTA